MICEESHLSALLSDDASRRYVPFGGSNADFPKWERRMRLGQHSSYAYSEIAAGTSERQLFPGTDQSAGRRV